MRWIDVAGPPGVGKSTLCDPLWGPHDVEIENLPPPPEWHDFCNEIFRLLHIVRPHPTFKAALRMNQRSVRKMATVTRLAPVSFGGRFSVEAGETIVDQPAYIQTGFIQRGLGFGWRLMDMGISVDELYAFFRLMPVSAGAVFLTAPEDIILNRNRNREKIAETAHENRSHMVPLMGPAIGIAKEVLHARGVSILELDTSSDAPEYQRAKLQRFAHKTANNPETDGSCGEIPTVPSVPLWW